MNTPDNNEVLFADEEPINSQQTPDFTIFTCAQYPQDNWKILIVDDDPEVHQVTKMILRQVKFEEKDLIFLSAYSAKEAEQIIQQHSDIAMIFLDVVMEDDDSGLKFVKYLREEMHNNLVRVVLRTGQPGQAPEENVIMDYDINDYKEKGELTAKKMFTTVITTLRSFRDLSNNETLKAENNRMGAELEVAHRLQEMALPLTSELEQIDNLDIVGFMEPVAEVGGDYYEVLNHDGHVKIGIGDVTGHGLESGVLMLMVQTTVRALLLAGITNPEHFLNIVNRTIYHNAKRMKTDKNLTLSLLDYQDNKLTVTGQHEEVLLVRKDGKIERIDTFDLGFMIGIEKDISKFTSHKEIDLQPGDGIVLYTDGITEAHNSEEQQYGLEQLCEVVSKNWSGSSKEVQQAVITDVKKYIGDHDVIDDIALLVLKQR